MKLQEITANQLNNFLKNQPFSQLLQSADWLKFQNLLNQQVWFLGIFNDDELVTVAGLINHQLPTNKSYIYCPRGPVFKPSLSQQNKTRALKLILSKARDITASTKNKEEIFFRFEPLEDLINWPEKMMKVKNVQPANTWLIDLQQPEDEILNHMHQKTRYNIRLAEKKQIKIKKLQVADWPLAWPLFKKTAERDQFNLHDFDYYHTMLTNISLIELWGAYQEEQLAAVGLFSFFGDTATYLHGASDYQLRKYMAPYLLHWQLIKEARQRAYKLYDFHGIAPESQKQHQLAGVTRFKKGFGGLAKNFPGTYDFVYESGWYRIYQLLRKINCWLKKIKG